MSKRALEVDAETLPAATGDEEEEDPFGERPEGAAATAMDAIGAAIVAALNGSLGGRMDTIEKNR